MSTCTSKRTAELVVSVLKGLRNEDSFKSLLQIITDNTSTIDFMAHHPLTAEDRYRESYFEAVDNMISAIRERFKQPSFEAYENMESLIVKNRIRRCIQRNLLRRGKLCYRNKYQSIFNSRGRHTSNHIQRVET